MWTVLEVYLLKSLVPQLKISLPWLIEEYQYPFEFPLLNRDGTLGGEKPFREMSPWSETLSDLKAENRNKLLRKSLRLIFSEQLKYCKILSDKEVNKVNYNQTKHLKGRLGLSVRLDHVFCRW